jgi:hypothetical protein
MTPPSPLSLVRMLMMKNGQGQQKNKGIVTSSMMKCYQGWKVIHLNMYVKKLLLIKLWKNEEDFEFFFPQF